MYYVGEEFCTDMYKILFYCIYDLWHIHYTIACDLSHPHQECFSSLIMCSWSHSHSLFQTMDLNLHWSLLHAPCICVYHEQYSGGM